MGTAISWCPMKCIITNATKVSWRSPCPCAAPWPSPGPCVESVTMAPAVEATAVEVAAAVVVVARGLRARGTLPPSRDLPVSASNPTDASSPCTKRFADKAMDRGGQGGGGEESGRLRGVRVVRK